MSREVRKCTRCDHFVRKERRCSVKKVNPVRVMDGIEVVQEHGASKVCDYCGIKEKILAEYLRLACT